MRGVEKYATVRAIGIAGCSSPKFGYVMDAMTEDYAASELPGLDLGETLRALVPICAWVSGSWVLAPGDARRWNGLQNTPNDVRLLTNLLLQTLRRSRV